MGFLDKAKAQANSLATKAQEGISQGQAKLDESQARKKAQSLLSDLGAWQWAMTHGRDGGVGATEIERLRAELTAHEAEHGEIGPPQLTARETPPGNDAAPPPPPA